jgi:hypothetical protein
MVGNALPRHAVRGCRRGGGGRSRAAISGLSLMALLALAMSIPTPAAGKDRNCCFSASVSVGGGYFVQYGSNPRHPYTGDYGASWAWDTRELVAYKNGELRDLGSKVAVAYIEYWDVNQHRFGTDAEQVPVACSPATFLTPNRGYSFVASDATRLSLGRSPAGRPAITVGLGAPYARIGPSNCTLGDEGDHAGEFSLDPWSYTVPGPALRFLRTANQGDNFLPSEFSGSAYSHPYEDAGVVSPHAFTGQTNVVTRLKYFPESDLEERQKTLKNCDGHGDEDCGPDFMASGPDLLQNLSGVPGANP